MRADVHRWVERAGAQVLVVDPEDDGGRLAEEMAGRGVHVTWVGSTTDGLVELGRTDPHAVVVAPRAPGIPVEEFVGVVRRHGSSYVIAGAASEDPTAEVGPLLLAGASAVVLRPYAAQSLWDLLVHAPRSLAEHTRLEVGPIELDASAYSVRIDGRRISDLPLKEFELLRALMLRAPGVVPDEELREALWGGTGRRVGPNTVAMHAARLRAHLAGAAVVRRVRGRGYSLAVDSG